MSDLAPKDRWDKLQVVAALIASLLVPLAVLVVGNGYSQSMKDSENRIKYVELAVSILRAEPRDDNAALRAWAVDLLQKQAIVPLSAEAQAQLKAQKLQWVDQATWDTTSGGNYKNPNIDTVTTECRAGCPEEKKKREQRK